MGDRLQSEPRNLEGILRATSELLERDGFKHITIEAIAARAGVSKVTIYRWWPNKAALVMHAFLVTMMPAVPSPDLGSVRQELFVHLRALMLAYHGRAGPVIAALIAEGQSDPALAEAFRASIVKQRRQPIRDILKRGIRRGELRPDIDIEISIDTLSSPIDYRLLTGHAPLDEYFISTLVDQTLDGLSVLPEK